MQKTNRDDFLGAAGRLRSCRNFSVQKVLLETCVFCTGLSRGIAKETHLEPLLSSANRVRASHARGPGFNSPHHIHHMVERTWNPSTQVETGVSEIQGHPLHRISDSEVNWTTGDLTLWKKSGREGVERGEREEKEKKGRWKGRGKTTPIWIKGTGSVNEQRRGNSGA